MYVYTPVDLQGVPVGDDMADLASRSFLHMDDAHEYALAMKLRYPCFRIERVPFAEWLVRNACR